MKIEHPSLIQAFGSCRAYVVLTEHFDHIRTSLAHVYGNCAYTKRNHRQDKIANIARRVFAEWSISTRRENPYIDGEDEQKYQAQHKTRNGCARQRQYVRKPIDPRIAMRCGINTERKGNHQRKEQGTDA